MHRSSTRPRISSTCARGACGPTSRFTKLNQGSSPRPVSQMVIGIETGELLASSEEATALSLTTEQARFSPTVTTEKLIERLPEAAATRPVTLSVLPAVEQITVTPSQAMPTPVLTLRMEIGAPASASVAGSVSLTVTARLERRSVLPTVSVYLAVPPRG